MHKLTLMNKDLPVMTVLSLHQSSVEEGAAWAWDFVIPLIFFDQWRAIKILHNAMIYLCHNFID